VSNLKLLTAINIAHSDNELLDVIDSLAAFIEDGTISADVDGDQIMPCD
jgi:hypothetical protein